MRLATIILVMMLGSCSWSWPWGKQESGSCLDDKSCDGSNPLEEALIGGTWYCYGVARNSPWDCSQTPDPNKIVAVTDETQAGGDLPPQPDQGGYPDAARVRPDDEPPAASGSSTADRVIRTSDADRAPGTSVARELTAHPDDYFAVQLIALQSVDEVESFAASHGMDSLQYVEIESQGSRWLVVILDIYENREAADAAAETWSRQYDARVKPWVRPLGPLKRAAERAGATDQ